MSSPVVQLQAICVTGAYSSFSSLHLTLPNPTQEGNTLFVGVFSDGILGLGHSDQGLDGLNAGSLSDNMGTAYTNLQIQTLGWPQQNIWTASTISAGITGFNVSFNTNLNSNYGILVVAEFAVETTGVDADSIQQFINWTSGSPYTVELTTVAGQEEFGMVWGYAQGQAQFQPAGGDVFYNAVTLFNGSSFGLYWKRYRLPGPQTGQIAWTTFGNETFGFGSIAYKGPPIGPYGPVELVGTILNPDLTGANGWLCLQLNTYGTVEEQAGGYLAILPNDMIKVRVNNGVVTPGTYVYGNDAMLENTYYIAQFLTDTGQYLFTQNWFISGDATWDVGAVIPISSADLPDFLGVSLSQISDIGTGVTQNDIQQENFIFAIDSGGVNNYAVTLTPAPNLKEGSIVVFQAGHTSTGASTVSFNGGSPINIKLGNGNNTGPGSILAGQIVVLRYDGTNMQLSGVTFEVNGTVLSAQQVVNFVAGTNVTLTDTGSGSLRIDCLSGGIGATGTVFGRQLPVVAQLGDYGFNKITGMIASTQQNIAGSGGLGAIIPDGTSIIVNPTTGVASSTAGIEIQVNNVNAASQSVLNLVAGAGVSVTDMGGGTIKFTASGSGITQLTGDVLAMGNGSVTATLATIPGVSGTWLWPAEIVVDTKGRITDIVNGIPPTGTNGGGCCTGGYVLDGAYIDKLTALQDGMTLQYSAVTQMWEPVIDKPFEPVAGVPGKPSPGQKVMLWTAATALSFPANFSGSVGSCSTAPAASATYIIEKNGIQVGTCTVVPNGLPSLATFVFQSSGAVVSMNADDYMWILAPTPTDATLADCTLTLMGYRSSALPSQQVMPILRWRGPYSNIVYYQPWDLVFYGGSTYLCIAAVVGQLPTNTTYFTPFAVGGGGTFSVTVTGSPAAGNLTQWASATSITNGDLSGDVATAGSLVTTIQPHVVSYAKMQQISAGSRLLGSSAATGAQNVQEISLGAGLSMSGTVLSVTATGSVGTVGTPASGQMAMFTGPSTLEGINVGPGLAISGSSILVSPAYTGDVSFTGTPASGQMAMFTAPNTIEGIGLGPGLLVSGGDLLVSPTISGTVVETGNPVSGELTKWSGPTSITNGDLSGDVATNGSMVTTIQPLAVTTGKIANGAVTYAKIQNVSVSGALLGSSQSGAGAPPSEITLGAGLSMSGSVLSALGTATGNLSTTGTPASGQLAMFTDAVHVEGIGVGTGLLVSGGMLVNTGSNTGIANASIGAEITNQSSQNISNATDTTPTMPTIVKDTGGFTGTANTLTVPAGYGGWYAISAAVRWANTSGSGERDIWIKKNGSFTNGPMGSSSVAGSGIEIGGQAAYVTWLNAGDALTLDLWQNSGGTLGALSVTLSCAYLGNGQPIVGSGAMALIGSVAASGLGAITFNNIPQSYTHLQLIVVSRSSKAGTGSDNLKLTLNNDTGSNYDYQRKYANGTTNSADQSTATTGVLVGEAPDASALASFPGHAIIDIPLYSAGNYAKTVSSRYLIFNSTTTASLYNIDVQAGWNNTAPITRIDITPATGPFAANSVAYLYGIGNNAANPIDNQTVSSYTAQISDAPAGIGTITMNVTGANTVTIPLNATVNFPIGTILEVIQLGAGQTTLAPATTGVVIDTPASLSARAQYSTIALKQIATNVWVAYGDLQ